MKQSRLQTTKHWRGIAWLILLLCLWMGSGGVLMHSDDLHVYSSSSSSVALGHLSSGDLPDLTCAACQWIQGSQSNATLIAFVMTSLLTVIVVLPLTTSALYQRMPHLCPLRAPPALV